MAVSGLPGATASAVSSVGRYFSAVNTIPSLFLVLLVFTLEASGAWSGSPDLSRALDAMSNLGIVGSVFLVIAALFLSLVLHPIQYTIVQLFEGYWGLSKVGLRASEHRSLHHRRIAEWLERRVDDTWTEIQRAYPPSEEAHWRTVHQEAQRLRARYPKEPVDAMPTRLGNMLRRYERIAGSLYGLDPFITIPLIASIAPREQVDYLDDQRTQLYLADRTVLTALLAAGISVIFLWRHGWWISLAFMFYGAAYLAYRGAIITAEAYGAALVNLIDLNRFDLYRQLHLPWEDSTDDEKRMNERLMETLRDHTHSMDYVHPSEAPCQPRNEDGAEPGDP